MVSDKCKYARTHEWARREGDKVIVGISDHAQDALGDITFVELPAAGRVLTKEKECGVIESVKAASDIFAPLGGTVTEINSELEASPEHINSEPYGAGWLFALEKVDEAEYDALMDAPAYEAFLESEV